MGVRRGVVCCLLLAFAAAGCGPGETRPMPGAAAPPRRGAAGPDDGVVTLIVFVDYRSPASRALDRMIDGLLAAHPGRLRWELRHLPARTDPTSTMPHRAALAAARQDGFWPMHDLLIGAEPGFGLREILQFARIVGLDEEALREDMDSPDMLNSLQLDRDRADELGVDRAPALVVGERVVTGVPTAESLGRVVRAAIDDIDDRG